MKIEKRGEAREKLAGESPKEQIQKQDIK